MSHGKPIIGICGGIGAGKSTVAGALERCGCLTIDSDGLNREVLARGDVIAQVREWWGDGVLTPDGRIDRSRLAERVFADEASRRRQESLVHPLIAARRDAMISVGIQNPAIRAITLDSPLLLESNLDRLCDAVVFVEASAELRLKRLKDSRGWDANEIERRRRWQLPLAGNGREPTTSSKTTRRSRGCGNASKKCSNE